MNAASDSFTWRVSSRAGYRERVNPDRSNSKAFAQHHVENVGQALAAEHPRIDATLHDRQCVAKRQLIAGQRAVGLAGRAGRHDRADVVQLADVRDQLDRNRQTQKRLAGEIGARGQAGQLPADTRHQAFVDLETVHQQYLLERALGVSPMQPDRTPLLVEHSCHGLFEYLNVTHGNGPQRFRFSRKGRIIC
jgi:hypothetical protein